MLKWISCPTCSYDLLFKNDMQTLYEKEGEIVNNFAFENEVVVNATVGVKIQWLSS